MENNNTCNCNNDLHNMMYRSDMQMVMLNSHLENLCVHVSKDDRDRWNSKVDRSEIRQLENDVAKQSNLISDLVENIANNENINNIIALAVNNTITTSNEVINSVTERVRTLMLNDTTVPTAVQTYITQHTVQKGDYLGTINGIVFNQNSSIQIPVGDAGLTQSEVEQIVRSTINNDTTVNNKILEIVNNGIANNNTIKQSILDIVGSSSSGDGLTREDVVNIINETVTGDDLTTDDVIGIVNDTIKNNNEAKQEIVELIRENTTTSSDYDISVKEIDGSLTLAIEKKVQ